jgi:ferredoxin
MKNIIIYFSSTGNSLFVAQYLTKHLDNCTAISITKIDTNIEIGDAQTNIGFVFPTYFFSMPKFFSDKISQLKLDPDGYFYGITTCNGFPGNTGYQLKNALKNKECDLSFFRSLTLPGNYIIEYAPPKVEVVDRRIKDSETQLTSIVSMISNQDKERTNKKLSLISKCFFTIMYRKQHRWHKQFHVSPSCTSCGLCKRACQFNNIEIYNGNPHWNNRCEHCVACIQLCPNAAIEFGEKTKLRNRYRNPSVSVNDLLK